MVFFLGVQLNIAAVIGHPELTPVAPRLGQCVTVTLMMRRFINKGSLARPSPSSGGTVSCDNVSRAAGGLAPLRELLSSAACGFVARVSRA